MIMKIIVGTKNRVKVEATGGTIYPGFPGNNIFTGIPGKMESFINNAIQI